MNRDSDIPGASRALCMATIAFAANFSVWILYAVIGLELQQSMQLSATQLGFVFASPMLTGALARIPLGILADRYNPKHIYTAQMLATVPSLLILPMISSLNHYLHVWLKVGAHHGRHAAPKCKRAFTEFAMVKRLEPDQ